MLGLSPVLSRLALQPLQKIPVLELNFWDRSSVGPVGWKYTDPRSKVSGPFFLCLSAVCLIHTSFHQFTEISQIFHNINIIYIILTGNFPDEISKIVWTVLRPFARFHLRRMELANILLSQYHSKRFEPRSISSLSSVIVRVSVGLKRTVGDSDWRFEHLSGSHLQSHCDIVPSVDGISVSGYWPVWSIKLSCYWL